MAIFQKKPAAGVPSGPVPRHIAIIMDGNGRWATNRGLPRSAGHAMGCEVFRTLAYYCRDLGMDYLTVYVFSTENWKRSADEVGAIMGLLKKYLLEALEKMERDKIRMKFFGDLSRLTPELRELSAAAEERSTHYEGFQANLCINYGGRDEILRAVRAWGADCAAGRCSPDELTEEAFSNRLYSAGIPDPELIIRPGGEQRISNFLLWQCAYSEFYTTDVFWPDFTTADLDRAIEAYHRRSRRFGGV